MKEAVAMILLVLELTTPKYGGSRYPTGKIGRNVKAKHL
jgi:hypothetical protein